MNTDATTNAKSFKRIVTLLGPAFVAAIAYVDPGNFATNLGAGARYGYMLLWVLIVANLMASLVQYLSAKLGLVTSLSLPEVVRTKLSRKNRIVYWAQAEIVALATDLAEVLGGAIALNILFNLPLLVGGVITSVVSILILMIQNNRGQKTFERVIIGLLLIIPIGFVVGIFMRPPDAAQLLSGVVPKFNGTDSILLATGMLGATVMPHVVYLHSALTRDRYGKVPKKRIKELLRVTRYDVAIAMVVAGGVNISMLVLAASALGKSGSVETLPGIYSALAAAVSPLVATLFAVSLLVSGLASTSVGCYAGSVIMDGLLKRKIPLILRRVITLIPALIMLAVGFDPTRTLVLSQVALSFGIPFALIPLINATASKKIMGEHSNAKSTTITAWVVAGIVIALNSLLILLTITGS